MPSWPGVPRIHTQRVLAVFLFTLGWIINKFVLATGWTNRRLA